MGDPGRLTLPCECGNSMKVHALVDSGASINLMPYSFYQKLNIRKLKATKMTIHMANRSVTQPRGIVEDILVKTGKFVFPIDFVVLDMKEDPNTNPTSWVSKEDDEMSSDEEEVTSKVTNPVVREEKDTMELKDDEKLRIQGIKRKLDGNDVKDKKENSKKAYIRRVQAYKSRFKEQNILVVDSSDDSTSDRRKASAANLRRLKEGIRCNSPATERRQRLPTAKLDIESREEEPLQAQSQAQSHSSIQSNVRTKTNIAWEHVTQVVDEKGEKAWICNFCQKVIGGGGINRVKKHLAGVKGEVAACPKVSPEVWFTMQGKLKETAQKEKEKRTTSVTILDDDEEMEEAEISTVKKGKRKSTSNLHPFFTKGINDPSQPTIKSAMQSKAKIHDVDLAIAMWFYDACIPMNACNSPFFQLMVDKIASIGYGYKAPNYHALRVNLLTDAKKSVSLIIDSLRSQWVDTGCTIMSDGWRDVSQRHLINFLVYCPKGISFLKSIDASDIESNATNLCNLFVEIVEMVGEKNVVQMVTNNAANYKLAGTKLCERYPSITWSPCATHCLNLVLKDLLELDNVKKKRPGWKEIIRPGATWFGTVFIALQSLYDHKEDLQAMVISNEFKKMLKVGNAVELKVMTPLLKLLRLCDSDEKPAIGYVYEGMRRARRGIKELFKKKKELYRPYTNIIDSCWDRMLRKSIYCAAYWLNPVFQYDHANLCKKNEVFQGVLEMVEKTFKGDDVLNITLNLGRFRDAEGTFGRSSAVASRNLTRPDEWWKLFGGDIPVLQKLKVDMRSYDPVDYENIDKTKFWVVEEEREGELNYDDLENMLDEQEHEPASKSQGDHVDHEVDSEF
ncbi:uncharacterized protein LOC111876721 [Lactuca sativa]|uniref:uncharacterized protein LOC111876721 n=1 Tax=Lactuca sativa TaxID=4236 RepID=UPI0022B058D9|nr:uncharacterized protein LOC111876721 [Lactuca sativa]